MPQEPCILVVDDDPHVARLLEEQLRIEFPVHAVTSPARALAALEDMPIGVVLADQRMPGMGGVELLTEARRVRPTVVGILITGHAEVDSAIRAINEARVLGFLTKPWDEAELFSVVRRALEAHHALEQLLVASSGTAAHEVAALERMSGAHLVPITAQRFGSLPLRDSLPDEFRSLSDRYGELLSDALDERVYKVDHKVSAALRVLSDRLGVLSAGPRDVIDMHVSALKHRLAEAPPESGAELVDVGRLLVLELMGDVVAYYRSYSLGVRA